MKVSWLKRAEQKVTVVNPNQFTQVKFLTNAEEVKKEIDGVMVAVKNLSNSVKDLRAELELLETVNMKIRIEVKEPDSG